MIPGQEALLKRTFFLSVLILYPEMLLLAGWIGDRLAHILGALFGGIASMLSLLVGSRALTVLRLGVCLAARLALGGEQQAAGSGATAAAAG